MKVLKFDTNEKKSLFFIKKKVKKKKNFFAYLHSVYVHGVNKLSDI